MYDFSAVLLDEADLPEPGTAKRSGKLCAHRIQNTVPRHAFALELAHRDKESAATLVDLHGNILGIDKRSDPRKAVFEDLGNGAADARLVRDRFQNAHIGGKSRRDIFFRHPARIFHVLGRIGNVCHEMKGHSSRSL